MDLQSPVRRKLRARAPKAASRVPVVPGISPGISKDPSMPAPDVRADARMDARTRRMFKLLAQTFQALGDASRVQIVWALSRGEFCVGDLARFLGMSQPAVSHHLRTLRNLQLVKVRRDGRASFYALDDEHIDRLLKEGILHVEDLLA